jgi:hypothetical protein
MTSDGNQIMPGGKIHIISFNKNVKLFFGFLGYISGGQLWRHISQD